MKFLNTLALTKQPSTLRRIDIALIVAILPHLPYLNGFMLIFLILTSLMIIFVKNVSKSLVNSFMFLGLIIIFVSFYGELNYAGISRFSVFIKLTSSTLIYVIMLQRLSGSINFYLLFSPALLLILSFFFYNSISMLLYMVFAIFTFSTMLLWSVMNTTLGVVLKKSMSIFLLSLPIVLILFLVFPRISFETSNYGFTNDDIKRTSHDGEMSIGSSSLLVPSSRIVMEILFDGDVPQSDDLYFRGSTLYTKYTDTWKQIKLKKHYFKPLRAKAKKTTYKVTLYPTYKPYIYSLDFAQEGIKNSMINDDSVIISNKAIKDITHYKITSYFSSKNHENISKAKRAISLDFNQSRYPQLNILAKTLKSTSDQESLDNLINYFKKSELIYSLKPLIDEKNPEESFLFKYKKGYCVHFASTFTLLARALNIPSRVVTGYKSNKEYLHKNYLIIKESDAHAWVEVYIDKEWKRIDPTIYASKIESQEKPNKYISELSLNYLYLKHIIENWILDYTRDKQMNILKKLLDDSSFALKFTFYVLIFISITTLLGISLRKDEKLHITQKPINTLLKKLEKLGYKKAANEDINIFLKSINIPELNKINRLYHKLRYSKSSSKKELDELKSLIKKL